MELYFFPLKHKKISKKIISYFNNSDNSKFNIPTICPNCRTFSGKTTANNEILSFYECDECQQLKDDSSDNTINKNDDENGNSLLPEYMNMCFDINVKTMEINTYEFNSLSEYYLFLRKDCDIDISIEYALELWLREKEIKDYHKIINSLDYENLYNSEIDSSILDNLLSKEYTKGTIRIGKCVCNFLTF